MDIGFLKKIGFSDKQAGIYLALLRLGPSSVRSLAAETGLNRGTIYDSLKWLQEQGVVSFFSQETKQQFVAEDPERLYDILRSRADDIRLAEKQLEQVVPELAALYHSGGERPVARYVAREQLSHILEDVLSVCEQDAEHCYRVYSSERLRPYLYEQFPTFSDVRIAKGIRVNVIAIGDGGELRGLDERKWLPNATHVPTYIFIYPGKTAYISLTAKQEPIGVVIDNNGIYETQRMIFDSLWSSLDR